MGAFGLRWRIPFLHFSAQFLALGLPRFRLLVSSCNSRCHNFTIKSNPINTYIHTYHLRTPRKARILINTQDYAMLLKPLHLPVSSRQCRCSHPALPNPTFPSHLPTVHSLRSTYSAHLAFPSLSCFFSKSLEESTYH